eukprot:COSAG02_NODE_36993_length_448_cov_0.478510_1_plen_50_part_10
MNTDDLIILPHLKSLQDKKDQLIPLCLFFKQKTAYEIMSGDWSSDVCSSD